MAILHTVLTVIYVIICIALSVLILMQEGKQRGLGSIAGSTETYWSQNKGRSMEGGLVKITRVLSILFFVLSLVLSMSFLNK